MYYILDSQTHTFLTVLNGSTFKKYLTRIVANQRADKLNLEYGASRYYVVFSLGDPRTYFKGVN